MFQSRMVTGVRQLRVQVTSAFIRQITVPQLKVSVNKNQLLHVFYSLCPLSLLHFMWTLFNFIVAK